jgi:excisionase family DNA binding protein
MHVSHDLDKVKSSGVDAEPNGCFGSSGSSPGRRFRPSVKVRKSGRKEPGSSPSGLQPPQAEPPQLLTRNQAARVLNVSVSAIRKWQREGRLAIVKLGSSVRVPMADLKRLIEAHTVPAATKAGADHEM